MTGHVTGQVTGKATLIIAGGGTGGHILAGIAVAEEWKLKVGGPVLFIGARGGLEETLVPKAGYALKCLRIGSLNRVSLKRKLRTLIELPIAMCHSVIILLSVQRKNRGNLAVLGVGGYASGPVLLMARVLGIVEGIFGRTLGRAIGFFGIHTAILEQNSIPGMTNRILGRIAQQVFCAFPGVEKQFNNGARNNKAVVTGNPVRPFVSKPLPAAPRKPFTIFIFGGSQGAMGINTLVIEALPFLKDAPIQFIHQTGEKDFERVFQAYHQIFHEISHTAGISARIEKFIYEMSEAYAKAALVICRSGSSSLSELAAVGRAAILIPFPLAANDHQYFNAKMFADAKAALLLPQTTTKGEELATQILKLMNDPDELDRMATAAKTLFHPNAARDIVKALQL